MNSIELNFRKTPKNPLVLKHYINTLYEKHHILEAKYYHEQLMKEDPSGLETNKIGYLLSIRLMNPHVAEFEKKLIKAGATQEQVYALQLHFYYTFSDTLKMRDCANGLLDIEPTEEYTYEIVIESVLKLEDFELASRLVKYYFPRIKCSDELLKALKRIMIKELLRIMRIKCR